MTTAIAVTDEMIEAGWKDAQVKDVRDDRPHKMRFIDGLSTALTPHGELAAAGPPPPPQGRRPGSSDIDGSRRNVECTTEDQHLIYTALGYGDDDYGDADEDVRPPLVERLPWALKQAADRIGQVGITDKMAGGAGFEPALPFGRTEFQSAAFNHSATPVDQQKVVVVESHCNPPGHRNEKAGRYDSLLDHVSASGCSLQKNFG